MVYTGAHAGLAQFNGIRGLLPTTNKIYVFGGEDAVSGVNTNATRIYDIASNSWSAGTPMPDVRSFMGSGYNSANGKIYLVSGYNTGTVDSAQPDTWEYDPVANACFTSKAMFPHPAGGMASGFINGVLYVAGGRDASNTVINLNWAYDPVADIVDGKGQHAGLEQQCCRQRRCTRPPLGFRGRQSLWPWCARFEQGCVCQASKPSKH